MNGLSELLPLWRELEHNGSDYVLATIVAVEGSSYRKPGARMILSADGRRAGTVSGGCLEAEVARKAWWVTAHGPVMKRYSMSAEDGEVPYGMGCGGALWLLLERRATATALFHELEAAFIGREEMCVATILDGPMTGRRDVAGFALYAEEARTEQRSRTREVSLDGERVRVWCEYLPARPALWIFGAGNDAQPLARMARQMGWFLTVADGRSHLATAERFPEADVVLTIANGDLSQITMRGNDAAVVMTHSAEQDGRLLATLVEQPLAYLGVLGPQRRTRELLEEIDPRKAKAWLERMHAPMGLDLGGNTPAGIALAALAEIQAAIHDGTALPMRQVKAQRNERAAIA